MNIDQAIKISNITVRNHYDESGSTKQELQRFAEAIRNATLDEAIVVCNTLDESSGPCSWHYEIATQDCANSIEKLKQYITKTNAET